MKAVYSVVYKIRGQQEENEVFTIATNITAVKGEIAKRHGVKRLMVKIVDCMHDYLCPDPNDNNNEYCYN